MSSFRSFLHVGGKRYEILYSDLFLRQEVDALGRPASLTLGGIFTVAINTPGSDDPTLFEWMVSPTKIMDGKVVLKRIDTNATLKVIKFYNAYCVDMLVEFDGTANASSFKTTIRVSPEQIDVGGLFHDNRWPDESPIHEIADEDGVKEPGLLSDIAHGVLDVVGLVPVVGELADGANALFYLAEGNKTDAALSAAAMIPIAGWAATGAKVVRKGSKALKAVLKNADSVTKSDILLHVQHNVPSLKLKGRSPDDRFHEFVDSRGTTRLKIHPPDQVTPYDHIHIYNRAGQPLNANLKVGDVKSTDVHIRIKP